MSLHDEEGVTRLDTVRTGPAVRLSSGVIRSTEPGADSLAPALAPVLAPLDKRALGIAIGLAVSLTVGGATLLSMMADPARRFPLGLLSNFFMGYDISGTGLLIGMAWGFLTGFVWGWFLAFTRNLVFAIWVLWVRVRADVAVSRDLLDHI